MQGLALLIVEVIFLFVILIAIRAGLRLSGNCLTIQNDERVSMIEALWILISIFCFSTVNR